MTFTFKQFIVPHFWKKFFILTLSNFFMGFFISILLEEGWGSDPCTFMNFNISERLGISLGTWQLSLNLVLLVYTIIFEPKLIGFGTLQNMMLIGYIADFFKWVWKTTGIHDIISYEANPPLAMHIGVFSAAIILFVISAAVYMNSQMGLSPYDSIAKNISNRFSRIPFFIIRICFDATAVIVGVVFSPFKLNDSRLYLPLIGAVSMVFLLGPVITAVGKFMGRTILNFDKVPGSKEI